MFQSRGRSLRLFGAAVLVGAGLLSSAPAASAQNGGSYCARGNPGLDAEHVALSVLIGNAQPIATATPGSGNPVVLVPSDFPSGGAVSAARSALGAQFTAVWISASRTGLDVGLAPGPLDAEAAEAAIVQHLAAAGLTPSQADWVAGSLGIVAQPYGEAELDETRAQASAALSGAGLRASVSIQCRDAVYRVLAEIDSLAAPDAMARAADLLAPFGDRVRFTPIEILSLGCECASAGPPPPPPAPPAKEGAKASPTPIRAAVPLGSYVSLAKTSRCVHGTKVRVRVRGARRADVRTVSVSVAGRRKAASGRKLAEGVAVKLRGRRTDLKVAVRLRSGETLSGTYRYTRCS